MFTIGDKVQIVVGPIAKVGLVGEIVNLYSNGAMVKIGYDKFSPIKFEHLEKIEDGEIISEEFNKDVFVKL